MKRLSAKQYASRLWLIWSKAPVNQRQPLLTAFLGLLQRQHALKLMPRITEHLQSLEDQADGLTRVRVESATAVDLDELTKQLKTIFGSVTIEATTNSALVAGLKIQVGDRFIDASVANQLRRLQSHLTDA